MSAPGQTTVWSMLKDSARPGLSTKLNVESVHSKVTLPSETSFPVLSICCRESTFSLVVGEPAGVGCSDACGGANWFQPGRHEARSLALPQAVVPPDGSGFAGAVESLQRAVPNTNRVASAQVVTERTGDPRIVYLQSESFGTRPDRRSAAAHMPASPR